MSDYEKVIRKADQLADEFEALKPKIDKVLFYLEDDPTTNSKGLISRLAEVENRLSDMVTQNKIDKGKKTVYFFIGGAIIWLIANFDKIVKLFSSVQIKH